MNIKYEKMVGKMLLAAKLKNASALARALGISPQALSNCKRKESIPTKLVFRFAEKFEVSIDWLIDDKSDELRPRFKKSLESGKEYLGGKEESVEVSVLLYEESEYVGKLLKILRTCDSDAGRVLKKSIDILGSCTDAAANGG